MNLRELHLERAYGPDSPAWDDPARLDWEDAWALALWGQLAPEDADLSPRAALHLAWLRVQLRARLLAAQCRRIWAAAFPPAFPLPLTAASARGERSALLARRSETWGMAWTPP
jgi:hypothetical protein